MIILANRQRLMDGWKDTITFYSASSHWDQKSFFTKEPWPKKQYQDKSYTKNSIKLMWKREESAPAGTSPVSEQQAHRPNLFQSWLNKAKIIHIESATRSFINSLNSPREAKSFSFKSFYSELSRAECMKAILQCWAKGQIIRTSHVTVNSNFHQVFSRCNTTNKQDAAPDWPFIKYTCEQVYEWTEQISQPSYTRLNDKFYRQQ